jgi:hypothetical protein
VGETCFTINGYQNENRVAMDWLRPLSVAERKAEIDHMVDQWSKMLGFGQGSHTLEALRRENQDCMHQLKDDIRQDNEARLQFIQEAVGKMITTVTALDGVLAKASTLHIANTIDPKLKDLGTDVKQMLTDLDDLKLQIAGQQGGQSIRDITTLSGLPFQKAIADQSAGWGKAMCATVEHTGPDNKPGDVVITLAKPLADVDLVTVIEAKNDEEGVGHTRIRQRLGAAVATRKAQAAVYVCGKPEGLAHEIKGFGEGILPGGQPYIATTVEMLDVALTIVGIRYRLQVERTSLPITDVAAIEKQLQRLTKLAASFSSHTTWASEAADAITKLRRFGQDARDEMKAIVTEIELILRSAPVTPEAAG